MGVEGGRQDGKALGVRTEDRMMGRSQGAQSGHMTDWSGGGLTILSDEGLRLLRTEGGVRRRK